MSTQQPSRLVRRWESLEMGLQFLIAYPVLIIAITFIHLTALNQSPLRSTVYGLFWALPAAFLVAIASQNEARKRRERSMAENASESTDSVES